MLNRWPLVRVDFTETYGISLTAETLRSHTWRWLQMHLYGLLSTESSRIRRALSPDKTDVT